MQAKNASLDELAGREAELVQARREATEEQRRIEVRLAELRGQPSASASVDAAGSMFSSHSSMDGVERFLPTVYATRSGVFRVLRQRTL